MYRLESEQCCKEKCLKTWAELELKTAEIKRYEYVFI